MNKVYAVQQYHDWEYEIVAVFTDSDQAEKFSKTLTNSGVEVYKLDPKLNDLLNDTYTMVEMWRDGSVFKAEVEYMEGRDGRKTVDLMYEYVADKNEYVVYLIYSTQKHDVDKVIKEANEIREKLIEKDLWPEKLSEKDEITDLWDTIEEKFNRGEI